MLKVFFSALVECIINSSVRQSFVLVVILLVYVFSCNLKMLLKSYFPNNTYLYTEYIIYNIYIYVDDVQLKYIDQYDSNKKRTITLPITYAVCMYQKAASSILIEKGRGRGPIKEQTLDRNLARLLEAQLPYDPSYPSSRRLVGLS